MPSDWLASPPNGSENNFQSGCDFGSTSGWWESKGSLTVSNNVGTVTGNGSDSSIYLKCYPWDSSDYSSTDKFFTYIKMRDTSGDSEFFRIVYDGLSGGSNKVVLQQDDPVQNQWYELYAVDTPPSNVSGDFKVYFHSYFGSSSNQNGSETEFEGDVAGKGGGAFVINLNTLDDAEPSLDILNKTAEEIKDMIFDATIDIDSYSRSIISDETGYDSCTVEFAVDKDATEWEARATTSSQTPSVGVGLLVGSGTNVTANETVTFSVDDEELTSGDRDYTITVYAKYGGVWHG